MRGDTGDDREVLAGVEVKVGSPAGPEVTWDFGDGTTLRGAEVRHAYARAGRFVLRSLDGATELSRAKLVVVPRPLLQGVPANATALLYLPTIRGVLEKVIDFLERLLGGG